MTASGGVGGSTARSALGRSRSAASAVQFVPEIAPRVDHLVLYQRTPNWVLPKADVPYSSEQLEQLRTDPDALLDARRQVWERVEGAITFSDPSAILQAQELALQSMAIVEDPEVRAKLTPTFPHGCKRPLVSNDWYPMFNRPNVELVTEAVELVRSLGRRPATPDEAAALLGLPGRPVASAAPVAGIDRSA